MARLLTAADTTIGMLIAGAGIPRSARRAAASGCEVLPIGRRRAIIGTASLARRPLAPEVEV
jgi:hypothetical protein